MKKGDKVWVSRGPMQQFNPCRAWNVKDEKERLWAFREDSMTLVDYLVERLAEIQYTRSDFFNMYKQWHKNNRGKSHDAFAKAIGIEIARDNKWGAFNCELTEQKNVFVIKIWEGNTTRTNVMPTGM